MKAVVVVAVVLLAVVAAVVDAAKITSFKLPKDVDLCQREDNACLSKAIQKALHSFKAGIPKLGVFPLDPLRVTEMVIDQGTGPVNVKLVFKNQDFIGFKDIVVRNTKSELTNKTYKLEIDAFLPQLQLIGDYSINGRVLVLPIQGEGRDNLTLTDFTAKVTVTGHIVTRDGEDYVVIDNFDIPFDTKRMYIQLENLFNGDKRLGDNMIVFLNENWRDILQELKPAIQQAFSAILLDISNRIYSKVPYNKIHLST